MFIGRRPDNSIYGLWTVRQWEGQEELPDDDQQVTGFPVRSAAELSSIARNALDEQERQQAKVDAQILGDINMSPADVATIIDTLFPAFTNAQRTFLKRLVRLAQIGARVRLRLR